MCSVFIFAGNYYELACSVFLSSVLSSLSCVFRSLSLGGLAGPNEAARSCVRVFVSVIRSPGTLRLPVTVPLLCPNQGVDGCWPVLVLR